MRNSYPGICYRCKQKVESGNGHFEKIPFEERKEKKIYSKWRLQHSECAIKFRGTKIGKEVTKNETI